MSKEEEDGETSKKEETSGDKIEDRVVSGLTKKLEEKLRAVHVEVEEVPSTPTAVISSTSKRPGASIFGSYRSLLPQNSWKNIQTEQVYRQISSPYHQPRCPPKWKKP